MTHNTTLSNIEELVFTARDPISKNLIREATAAYHGGAFKAAILSTWVAVSYDIITKIRELSGQGDQAAIAFTTNLTTAINTSNRKTLQTIENSLLTEARDTFQFLAPHQFTNLDRLRADRNLCAHPAFVSDDELFQPTAELARTHIVNSLLDLLQHAPLQGKTVIDRLSSDLLGPTFPISRESIREFVKDRYLKSARESLIVSMIKALISCPLGSKSAEYAGKERQITDALATIAELKPKIFDETAPPYIQLKAAAANAPEILNFIRLAAIDARIWHWINPADRIRIQKLVENASPQEIKQFDIFDGFEISDLKASVEAKFMRIGRDWQQSTIADRPRASFAPYVAPLYAQAASFRQAEAIGWGVVEPMISYLNADQVAKIIEAAQGNGQIFSANQTPELLTTLYQRTKHFLSITGPKWRAFTNAVLANNESYLPIDTFLKQDGY